jgi:hypothetical protein
MRTLNPAFPFLNQKIHIYLRGIPWKSKFRRNDSTDIQRLKNINIDKYLFQIAFFKVLISYCLVCGIQSLRGTYSFLWPVF